MQCSVVLATSLRVQRSDSSKRSPAVAMLATHLLFLDLRVVNNLVTSRIVRQSQWFPEVRSRQEQLLAVFNVTSLHDHQRVPHSFRDSHLSVAKSRGTSNTRAPLPRHHKQRTIKDSTALRYHDCCVSALCPVRNPVLDTYKWAVQHMMDVSHYGIVKS